MASSFSATVDAWVAETEERLIAVFREAAQRVIEKMQVPVGAGGNMPVDTGFLRASLLATLNSPAEAIRFKPENVEAFAYADQQVALVIAAARIGDTIYAVYTANYARFQEYGTEGRAGRGFVRLAAQQWQQVVSEVAAEAQARAAGRPV
jgi:hypothetical protein